MGGEAAGKLDGDGMREQAMADGTCVNCAYFNPYPGICSNPLSDRRGQYMPFTEVCDEYVCDEYTEQEDEDEKAQSETKNP